METLIQGKYTSSVSTSETWGTYSSSYKGERKVGPKRKIKIDPKKKVH